MSTDRPRLSLFFKMQPNASLPGDSNRDCHQYSLTPSAVCREPGGVAGFGKPRFKSPKLLRLNGGEHPPHSPASSGVNDPRPGIRKLGPPRHAYGPDCPQKQGIV